METGTITAFSRQLRHGGLLTLVLFLAGCAMAPERPDWPDNLPQRAYYEARYAADEYNQQHQSKQDYLRWVKRFYHGWGGVQGWLSIREQILADVDPADRDYMRDELARLGKRIAAEWAKQSDRRTIFNKTVQVWINAAYEAGTHGDHRRLLRQISTDVDALLADSLQPSQITLSRYYPDAAQPPAVGSLDSVGEE